MLWRGEIPKGLDQILRLISDLKPNNAIQMVVVGDLFEMAESHRCEFCSLPDDEVLLIPGEDIKSCFYPFSFPEKWKAYVSAEAASLESHMPAALISLWVGSALWA